MKVRNNTNGDFSLVFTDGHSINFSRAEISRELTDEEIIDPKLVKSISGKYKHIVIYKEPVKEDKKEEPKKSEEKEVPKEVEEEVEEKETVVIEKEDKPKERERRTSFRGRTPKAREED